MVGFAAWLDDNDAVVIICSALNGFVTWPFAGALGLPAAADIVLRKGRLGSTVKWCIYAVLLVGVPTLAFDSWMYVMKLKNTRNHARTSTHVYCTSAIILQCTPLHTY